LFLLRARGDGDLFVSSFGAITEIQVDGEHIVDNGFMVGFDAVLSYRLQKLPGLKTLFFGEGLVCRFSGRGRLLVQSRKPRALASFLHPFRPVKQRSRE
jgi:uncharacterized protein (AIM24 family)